jgi:coproporphyrinogen III oxidase-like Fe-S oxidoreductase
MMNYSFPLYRPPAEADNVIVQATYGCSYNGCSFCSMYTSKRYEARALEEVCREIDTLASYDPGSRRVFLADGDALALPTAHLLELLNYLKTAFPKLGRVSSYASAQNLLEKSEAELRSLREAGLTLLYYGIESGNDAVLQKINKGVTAEQMADSLDKAHNAGMKVSATVILGIGGKEYSEAHIRDTAALVNAVRVNYLSTLQLGLDPGIETAFLKRFGAFTMPGDAELLHEQRRFLERLTPRNRVIFRSNHASNALHLAGTLPRDTPRLLAEVDAALEAGEGAFVPKSFRGF